MDKQGSFLLSVQQLIEEDFTRTACGVAKIKKVLEPGGADALENLIAGTQISTRKISETLKAHGHIIGDGTIWKHRRRSCACYGLESKGTK